MLHNIITRREAEIKDLMEGIEEFGLVTFLRGNKETVTPVLFPRIAEAVIDKEAVVSLIRLEDEDETSAQLLQLLKQYIVQVEDETNGKVHFIIKIIIHLT